MHLLIKDFIYINSILRMNYAGIMNILCRRTCLLLSALAAFIARLKKRQNAGKKGEVIQHQAQKERA